MALVTCTECKKEYSDKAKACPSCGCPTINNTIEERRKSAEKCSIEIKGNERLFPKTSWISIFKIIIPMLIIWIFLMNTKRSTLHISEATSVFIVVITWGSILLSSPLSKFFPEYKIRKKNANIINEYFKKRFSLLDAIPENYLEIKTIEAYSGKKEAAMFDICMDAYKFNADAIVINNSNVITQVTSFVKDVTTTTNTFNITATLVKY